MGRDMHRYFIAVFLIVASLGGCSNNAGIAEFKVYTQTIDTLVKASQPIVDRLAVAERRNAVRLIDRGETVNGASAGTPDTNVDDEFVIAPRFAVEHARYFAESGYPPLAGSINSAFRALDRFNRIALIYANGQSLDSARTDIENLSRNISTAAELAGATLPGAGTAVNVALEGGASIAAFGSRDAFREILKEQGTNLISLLEALRNNSPAVFEQLTQKLYDDRELQKLLGEPIDQTVGNIRRERTIVGEWVVMLDSAIVALRATLAAIDAPATLSTDLGDAVFVSGEINAGLGRIRSLMAENQ